MLKRLFVLLAAMASVAGMAQTTIPSTITVNHDINTNVSFAIMLQENLDQQGGGSSWPYSFTGQGSFQNPFEQGTEAGILTMVGLYGQGDSESVADGVTVMTSSEFSGEGLQWEEFFSGVGEEDVLNALISVRDANGDQAMVDAGLNTISQWFQSNKNMFPRMNERATFFNFSQGTNVGTGFWTQQPVPEPATLLAVGAGTALLLARRRRRA
jgi:hypothetical protein